MHGVDLTDINPDHRSITIGGGICTLSTTISVIGGCSLSQAMKLFLTGQWRKLVCLASPPLLRYVPSNIPNISGEYRKLKPLDLLKSGLLIAWTNWTSLSLRDSKPPRQS